jgi:hypothetical protein
MKQIARGMQLLVANLLLFAAISLIALLPILYAEERSGFAIDFFSQDEWFILLWQFKNIPWYPMLVGFLIGVFVPRALHIK